MLRIGQDVIRCVALAAFSAMLTGCFDDHGGSGNARLAVPAGSVPRAGTILAPSHSNQPPEITGLPAAAVDAGEMYAFTPVASDADQDFLEFSVTNKPAWAQFDIESGTLTGMPGESDVGETEDITINVTDGREQRAVGPFRISIRRRGRTPRAGNSPPAIAGSPAAAVGVGAIYDFQPVATDADRDRLTFSISNRPAWATFSTASGRLRGTPTTAASYANIVIAVSDGKAVTTLPAFGIQVQGADNKAPTIAGAPITAVQASQAYSFQPQGHDPDGDRLTYSIGNKPAWARFDSASGRLHGTPAASHVGSYPNISISVSDGKARAALATFAIDVQDADNHAPVISGTPARAVTTGARYAFQPAATDADGDALGYTIQNRPSWAAFNTSSGMLSGTPTQAGTYGNIIVSVSDGRSTTSLPAFAIDVSAAPVDASGTATLSWAAPTANVDGSELQDLAGYRVAYGTSAEALHQIVEVADPHATSVTIDGLHAATWFFAVKAFNAHDMESELSGVASKTIN